MGGEYDNKEGDLNGGRRLPRALGYKRRSDNNEDATPKVSV